MFIFSLFKFTPILYIIKWIHIIYTFKRNIQMIFNEFFLWLIEIVKKSTFFNKKSKFFLIFFTIFFDYKIKRKNCYVFTKLNSFRSINRINRYMIIFSSSYNFHYFLIKFIKSSIISFNIIKF